MKDTLLRPASQATAGVSDSALAIPEPPARMSKKERQYYDYIASALYENRLCRSTDGMMLMVIARTFREWIELSNELDAYKKKNGSYMSVTPNGYEQPCQLYYVVRNLKRELLQWLPEACLTIPSFEKIKKVTQMDASQGSLFDDDPLTSFINGNPSGMDAYVETTH